MLVVNLKTGAWQMVADDGAAHTGREIYKMPIVTEDLIDKELKALFKVGGYRSEQAVVGHALEVLLVANPTLRLVVAVELYGTGEVTLARASEIGGVSVEIFKENLHEEGMARTVDFSKEEVIAGSGRIDQYRQSNA